MGRIDGDLDGDGATTNLFALESIDGLLLFLLVTDIDKSVSLAPSGLTPPPSNDAGGNDMETCISKESGESGIVDAEAEVGNKENGLGGFADRILTGGTRGTMAPRPAVPGPWRTFRRSFGPGNVGGRNGGLSFSGLGLVAALRRK